MSTLLGKKREELLELIDDLRDCLNEGMPVIVEGENDVETLKSLGVNGDIIAAKAYGKNFHGILEEIESRKKSEVILLMDFDRRGRQMTKKLQGDLERMRIKPNLRIWRELVRLAGKDLKDVEGLLTYMRTLERKIGKNI
ncbi:MAG: toprim domain-containing protein [Nitrososphaerota archaeon]|nr:toprim domain-containing protein [Candidatus Bathyarchaeota archaeon]MDW8048739.1 toprim domain-containing protein [Nitrososphaerota archaeon]